MGAGREDMDRLRCDRLQQTQPASSTRCRSERFAMPGHSELSPTALRCLDRQLAEALDLAVACRLLSDRARRDGEPLTAAVLQRLASDLTDEAGSLLPLLGVTDGATTPPLPEG